MSYNIHGCVDAEGNIDLQKIAEIVVQIDPDIIALQEVDSEEPFFKNRNQAEILGKLVGMNHVYFPIEKTGLRVFGLAVMSRYQIQSSKFKLLPSLYPRLKPRKRGVMRTMLNMPNGSVTLINTHLSVFMLEREIQLNEVLRWNGLPENAMKVPIILCGDLNARPSSFTYRRLSRFLNDVQKSSMDQQSPIPTFHARSPFSRIDHIFVSHHFTPFRTEVIRTPQTKVASDHLPLVVDLAWE